MYYVLVLMASVSFFEGLPYQVVVVSEHSRLEEPAFRL